MISLQKLALRISRSHQTDNDSYNPDRSQIFHNELIVLTVFTPNTRTLKHPNGRMTSYLCRRDVIMAHGGQRHSDAMCIWMPLCDVIFTRFFGNLNLRKQQAFPKMFIFANKRTIVVLYRSPETLLPIIWAWQPS